MVDSGDLVGLLGFLSGWQVIRDPLESDRDGVFSVITTSKNHITRTFVRQPQSSGSGPEVLGLLSLLQSRCSLIAVTYISYISVIRMIIQRVLRRHLCGLRDHMIIPVWRYISPVGAASFFWKLGSGRCNASSSSSCVITCRRLCTFQDLSRSFSLFSDCSCSVLILVAASWWFCTPLLCEFLSSATAYRPASLRRRLFLRL